MGVLLECVLVLSVFCVVIYVYLFVLVLSVLIKSEHSVAVIVKLK